MTKIDDLPYFAIGHGELKDNEKIGKTATCPNCGNKHRVIGIGEDLQFIKCVEDGETYLVGVGGKSIK
jgi:ssDNA-binding Zn-finger/Zn-ribbon topoisomerase 1